jgi:hypothetical protein
MGSVRRAVDSKPVPVSVTAWSPGGISSTALPATPVTDGGAPLQIEACATPVSVGTVESDASAAAPSFARAAKTGALPCSSQRSIIQSAAPSSDTRTTRVAGGSTPRGSAGAATSPSPMTKAADVRQAAREGTGDVTVCRGGDGRTPATSRATGQAACMMRGC